MKKIILILFLFILQFANGQTQWKTFHSENGMTIELPEYFSKGIVVAGGTLQWFNNTVDDAIQLSIESFGEGTIKELEASYQSDLEAEPKITYKVKKNTWYVISGINENGIFYNKSIIKNGVQYHLRIIYQEKNKAFVEKLLARISSSFK